MTTAHRPTWKAAVGQKDEGAAISTRKSGLDAPAHRRLKFRSDTDDGNDNKLQASLAALAAAESTAVPLRKKIDPATEQRSRQRLLKQTAEVDTARLKAQYDDDLDEEDLDNNDDDNPGGESKSGGGGDDEESDLDASSDSDEDDDDDEAALMAELAKIRAERAAAQEQQEQAAAQVEEAKDEEVALLGNPLLQQEHQSKRRRWNEDVVFRNQAKGEPSPKKRFINDTVRNDFHRRFLNKFIR